MAKQKAEAVSMDNRAVQITRDKIRHAVQISAKAAHSLYEAQIFLAHSNQKIGLKTFTEMLEAELPDYDGIFQKTNPEKSASKPMT